MTAPTVKGIPLAPGERVVYFRHDPGNGNRTFLLVLGVLTLVMIVGVVFIILAFQNHASTIAVTTHRFILLKGTNPASAQWVEHGQVREVQRIHQNGGLRNLDLVDAWGNRLSFYARGNTKLVELVSAFVANPALAAQAPTVPHLP